MSNPATSNDPKVIARLLRSLATGTVAKEYKHDVVFNAAADLLDPPTQLRCSAATEDVVWRCVNDEPFEYAIQQGPHGDEFVKLLNGQSLKRPAFSAKANLHELLAESRAALARLGIPDVAQAVPVNAAELTETLIQAAVDYEAGRCGQREISEARAAVEAAIAQPPAAPVERYYCPTCCGDGKYDSRMCNLPPEADTTCIDCNGTGIEPAAPVETKTVYVKRPKQQ